MTATSQIMDIRQLYSGLIRLYILHRAAQEGVFGLGVIEDLARHGYKLSPGTLYPILHQLEQCKLLRSKDKAIGGKIRRVYRTTAAGRKVLTAAKQKGRELFGKLFEHQPARSGARRNKMVAMHSTAYHRHASSKAAR